jgi:hypothetical protein
MGAACARRVQTPVHTSSQSNPLHGQLSGQQLVDAKLAER